MELLKNLNEKQGTTLFIVTHDINVASYGKMIIRILDGEIVNG
ncbi:MAG: macrolide ABC transporter ATP-binding protein, partial [Candidatus Omnitrophica bacterium]|nr:macrolide ABC transporter ATP-binding protein [Candidatus Omnitrophota bacterium]